MTLKRVILAWASVNAQDPRLNLARSGGSVIKLPGSSGSGIKLPGSGGSGIRLPGTSGSGIKLPGSGGSDRPAVNGEVLNGDDPFQPARTPGSRTTTTEATVIDDFTVEVDDSTDDST